MMTDRGQGSPAQPAAGLRRARAGRLTLLAAAACGALLWARADSRRPRPPVILPAHVVASGSPGWTPGDVSMLLLHRKELNLRPDQAHRLTLLADAEHRSIAPTLEAVHLDEASMNRFVESAEKHGGATLQSLQASAAEYTADSRELSSQHRAFWARAMDVLSPAQRARAEQLSQEQFVPARQKQARQKPTRQKQARP